MARIEIRSPYDERLISELTLSDSAAARRDVERLKNFFKNPSSDFSKENRIRILNRFKILIDTHQEQIIAQAINEGGKPLRDTQIEMERAIDGVAIAIRELQSLAGREIPMGISESSRGRIAFTHHVPKGIVLAISAFNHPINLFIHQVIPALAAGCPVLFKPALETPLTALLLAQLLCEAGLPEDALRVCICPNEVAEELVGHPDISYLNFIGSARVGWYLRSKLTEGAGCVLEHGGAAPAVVDQSADLDLAVRSLTRAAFYHSGQVCVSVQRIYVHRSVREEFVTKFVDSVSRLKGGDPVLAETDFGPLIRCREVDRIESWVGQARASGAQVLCGGTRMSPSFFAPTVLLEPPPESLVSTEEIFGPVVCVYSFDDLEHAFEAANRLKYAFQACVFTDKLDVAMTAFHSLDGLAVMVNEHAAFRVDWMPFGGYRSSGLGVGGIGATLRDLMHEKLCVMKSNSFLRE